jgi:hypothetical protein
MLTMADTSVSKPADKSTSAPVLTAFVKINRKVNSSTGDRRTWSLDIGAADDDRNADWAPEGQPGVLPISMVVSGDVGDALDVTKTYRLTLEQVD